MAEETKLVTDSAERVAYDLTLAIYSEERSASTGEAADRAYWLRLYQDCIAVVRGAAATEAIAMD